MFLKHKLRSYLAKKLDVPSIPHALERLVNIGFQPQLIFDVGAYQGDFARLCLELYPISKIACFEALDHRVKQLEFLARENSKLQVFPVLLGSSSQEQVPLHQAETASSVLVENIPQDFPITFHPMRTIDQIMDKHFQGHNLDFLKLDVQGYEMEVLNGAEKSLPNVSVILAEVNFLDIHQNVPLLAEIITWLNERDFVAYDICALTRRPLDRALWQADLIFVKRDSSFRSDKHWQS